MRIAITISGFVRRMNAFNTTWAVDAREKVDGSMTAFRCRVSVFGSTK